MFCVDLSVLCLYVPLLYFTSVYLHTTGGIQKDKMFERIFIQDLYVESEDLFILGLGSIKPPSPPLLISLTLFLVGGGSI